jgi:hypothetical protein
VFTLDTRVNQWRRCLKAAQRCSYALSGPLLLLWLQEEEEEEEQQQQLGHDEDDDDEAMHDADDAGPHMGYAADDGASPAGVLVVPVCVWRVPAADCYDAWRSSSSSSSSSDST